MRNFLLIVLVLFIFTFSASAQSDFVWKTFAPGNEEFSIEVPETFTMISFPSENADSLRLYKTISNKTYFLLASDKNDGSSFSRFPSALVGANDTEPEEITIDNLPGKKFNFVDAEGFYQEILFVNGKERVYVFHTVSETKTNSAVKRFLSSLRLNRTIPATTKPAGEENRKIVSAQNQELPKIEAISGSGQGSGSGGGTGSGSGTGSGYGTGSGNGVGSGSTTNQVNSPGPISPTSPLAILSKPKPSYTDLARFYQISGTVQVRVTFSASGEIGDVTPVTKLPFGLTSNAINAARGIKFEPAKKDGTAYTAVKSVVYSFTLY